MFKHITSNIHIYMCVCVTFKKKILSFGTESVTGHLAFHTTFLGAGTVAHLHQMSFQHFTQLGLGVEEV